MAKVSASALDARAKGYLKPSDTIVFNVFELLDVAKKEARALSAAGYRPPLRVTQVPVAGRSAIATIKASLVNLRDDAEFQQIRADLQKKVDELAKQY